MRLPPRIGSVVIYRPYQFSEVIPVIVLAINDDNDEVGIAVLPYGHARRTVTKRLSPAVASFAGVVEIRDVR